ncbi:MAG: hypothetical protein U0M15_06660 [Bacillota bacterium]|nr:hypothetical protein [Bacillota bacterium]
MSETIKGLKLIVTIVNRGKGKTIIEAYRQHGVTYHLTCLGRGTAKTELLEYLGLGQKERDIVLSIAEYDEVPPIMNMLNEELDFREPGHGIAFTIPLASVGGPTTLKYFMGMFDKGEGK